MNTDINTPTPDPLLRLADADRVRLGEALQALLAHGSILGLEAGDGDLYAWSRQNFDWLREMAALAGLAVSMEHESRLIQAVPERPAWRLGLNGIRHPSSKLSSTPLSSIKPSTPARLRWKPATWRRRSWRIIWN